VKLLNDILTGKDNLTFDAARVIGVLGAAAYIVFWTVQVAAKRRFEPADADAYGRGLGFVLLAMSGAVMIKQSAEPAAREEEIKLLREEIHGEIRAEMRGDPMTAAAAAGEGGCKP
jgi:hypothetical protein